MVRTVNPMKNISTGTKRTSDIGENKLLQIYKKQVCFILVKELTEVEILLHSTKESGERYAVFLHTEDYNYSCLQLKSYDSICIRLRSKIS